MNIFPGYLSRDAIAEEYVLLSFLYCQVVFSKTNLLISYKLPSTVHKFPTLVNTGYISLFNFAQSERWTLPHFHTVCLAGTQLPSDVVSRKTLGHKKVWTAVLEKWQWIPSAGLIHSSIPRHVFWNSLSAASAWSDVWTWAVVIH